MDNQRLILFVVLGLLSLMLWQSWVEYNTPQQPVQKERDATTGQVLDKAAIPATPEMRTEAPAPASATTELLSNPARSGETVTIETDLLKVELNTYGAGVNKVWLRKYTVDIDHPDELFQLMNDTGKDIYTAQGGLLVQGRKFPTHKTLFTASKNSYRLADGQDTLNVEFVWNSADGITYKKSYSFHRDSYAVDIKFRVLNTSTSLWNGYQYHQFERSQKESQGSFNPASMVPSYTGGAIYTEQDKYSKISFSDMQDENLSIITSDGWVGMLQHYFVGAWLLEEDGKYEMFTNKLAGNRYFIGYKTLEPLSIQPGAAGELTTRIYMGPKETRRLKDVAPGLKLTVDYGWLTPISAPLYWLLDKIHLVVGNWGWAIIILTMLIKLAFYPLSAASHRSMANMRKMTPRIKTLKERYADDKQKLNQAMMKLYKEEKINPLGGCLPVLIQIPVFIALYWALLESVELRQAPWILWIRDLSAPDPYFVLPILMGASMLGQQMLSAVAMDPLQKRIMMAMPIVFTFFFLFFPSGLVLYWTVNNLLTIAQQYTINKKMGV
ncbi:MAG: membrane protein insertase YidC [Gammaproteobacteria bacterium]|nr:MAG: membrane protein insertase YidC [Gammaproteobacteria bacterium]